MRLLAMTAALAAMTATPTWAVTYDCNLITIKGNTTLTYSFNPGSRTASGENVNFVEAIFQKNGMTMPPRVTFPSWHLDKTSPTSRVITQDLDPSYQINVEWKDGDAVSSATLMHNGRSLAFGNCSWSSPPVVAQRPAYQPTVAPAPAPASASVASNAIPIMWSGGSWVVDAKFGSMVRTMVLDTGATVISLNKSTAETLVASGQADWLDGTAEMTLADGRTTKSSAIKIHEVQIGSYRKTDVPAVVNSDDNGTELFGVMFLNTAGRFTVDAKNHQLILG